MVRQQAIETLWQHGYRANASTVFPSDIVVLDPVLVVSGSENRIEYKRVTLRANRVAKFISDRS